MFIDCQCSKCGYEKTINAEEETSYGCPVCGAERGYEGYSRIPWLKCSCGKRVNLIGFTNECECGKLYNTSGDELKPYEEWISEYYDCYD